MVLKRGSLQHIEINVSDLAKSKAFYGPLLKWMGYRRIVEGRTWVGWDNGQSKIFLTDLEKYKDAGFHRQRVGVNHIAFQAESKEEVDEFHKQFLIPTKANVLYGGPKLYPEYAPSYYAVYFEDPDRIKLEYVHVPDYDKS